jgi:hypothetical protein
VRFLCGGVMIGLLAAPVLYTNDDLLRLFGPAAPAKAEPASRPAEADWSLVEGVLAREQERRIAEQTLEIERAKAATPEPAPDPLYPVAWRLGFPASVWWKKVWCAYTGREGTPGTPGLVHPCPASEPVLRPYRP